VGAYDALYHQVGAFDAVNQITGAYDASYHQAGAYDRQA
jgi:hypothetical protein